MRRTKLFIFIILLSYATSAADELPIIQLNEGLNEISISIINNWDRDISRLSLYVNSKKLPEWLSVLDSEKAIDIRQGAQGQSMLILKLFMKHAPFNGITEFPVILKDISGNRWSFQIKISTGSQLPKEYALYENYPNPFNPTTTIKYSIKENIWVKLIIYNVMGQVVRTLVDETKPSGVYMVKWDGRNENSEMVSSGVYFYRLEAGKFIDTNRMMFVR